MTNEVSFRIIQLKHFVCVKLYMYITKTCKRNIKFGKVSGPQATSRGALPVRQYHKTH